ASIADAIAHDQVLRAVDGDPAVVGIDDGDAEHAAAAHRVADQVIVNGVATQDAFLAKMGEAGIADPAGAAPVVHGVAAYPGRIGTSDAHISRKVGRLAADLAPARVLVRQRLIEVDGGAVNPGDVSRFAAGGVRVLAQFAVAGLAGRAGDEQLV